ncbi:TBC-domain-containing protein [Sistotremastrum niveocremeum HHB9708]|uniref:TBC-domain-containing protein n=2 Tax=Sistotremastraceae TaxID=3402574 RepID=A0A164R298_9AGAM|nr:TBC-domain-containing protein [Sistotremastrum niveocremeum HHB9708]KZT32709.1 TBC-domain-containing protein [Sistotremastrum suecicum HHB10207 ss-3]
MAPSASGPSNTKTAHAFNKLLKSASTSTISRAASRLTRDVEENVKKLASLILIDGIPFEVDSTLRPRIWKILLQVNDVNTESYLHWVSRGPCEVRDKIRNDTFRTLATDLAFKSRVREDMLVRLLDAFVWRHSSSPHSPSSPLSPFPRSPPNSPRRSPFNMSPRSPDSSASSSSLPFTYVQGMNVLAAPFLYIMPTELEAFFAFCKFIEVECPLYVQPTLEGVHRGLKLLDRSLKLLDPELFAHLRSKNLSAEIYAFPSVLTLCACTPPLDQVLRLWDFLLAFGVHLNILCVIAQLLLIRDEIMASSSPMKILRTFPPLDAQPIIAIAVTLVRDLPPDLYKELVKHPRIR